MFHRESNGSHQLLCLEKDVNADREIDRSARANRKFPEHGEWELRLLRTFAWDVFARIDLADERRKPSESIFAKRL